MLVQSRGSSLLEILSEHLVYISFQQVQALLVLKDHLRLACLECFAFCSCLEICRNRYRTGVEGKDKELRGESLSWV